MKFLHVILHSGVAIRKYIMNLESVYGRQWGRTSDLGSCKPAVTQMSPPPRGEWMSARAAAAAFPHARRPPCVDTSI